MLCGCDYNDCGGEAMPYDFGPPVWNWKMATVRLWGESPRGTWTLRITDRRTANTHATATLNRWAIYVTTVTMRRRRRRRRRRQLTSTTLIATTLTATTRTATRLQPVATATRLLLVETLRRHPPTHPQTRRRGASAAGGLFGLSLPITIAIFAGAAVAVALLILVVVLVCYCCYCTGGDRGPRRTPTTRATPAQVKRNAPTIMGCR